ncbi:hypothetical protein BWD42_03340 [Sphingobacterium sp. CZ-UAM]|nr:hypothetical protein BWD42_03340 [Sphingobacterium sp. CZ-UAM]
MIRLIKKKDKIALQTLISVQHAHDEGLEIQMVLNLILGLKTLSSQKEAVNQRVTKVAMGSR